MKKRLHIPLTLGVLLAVLCAPAPSAWAQDEQGGRYELMVTGTVRDRDNGAKLDNVTVSIEGTSIATVTNADGYFSLKFPRGVEPNLNFALIGYENCSCVAEETGFGRYVANVTMKTTYPELDLAIIFGDGRGVVEAALQKIPDNYPMEESLMSAFYRETVQRGRRYISVAEAIMDVCKTDYKQRVPYRDVVTLTKARRLLSQKSSDTLGVKIAGGPNLALAMDFVKNKDLLFDLEEPDYYDFTMMPYEKIDDRVQYVVEFVPRVRLGYALYSGTVYIDKEDLSFTRAVFSLDLSDIDKATAMLVFKKPVGLRFRPQEVSFLVTYRRDGGVTRLNYIRNEMRFKCDWKRLAFSSAYVVRSEMVVVEREAGATIDRKNAFRTTEVFYDMVQEYWDADFWSEYNIIEPTESLENAVRRLKRRQESTVK